MAITRGATTTGNPDSSSDHTDASFTHTVDPGTSLLLLVVTVTAVESVQGTPTWNTSENFTLISATTSSGSGNDMRTYVYGIVNPTIATSTVSVTLSVTSFSFAGAANYLGTVTTSVAAATNLLEEVVNNAASSTTAFASSGTAGNGLVVFAGAYGGDMTPASNASSFVEVFDGGTGTSSTSDLSYYYADIVDTAAASAVTVTWTNSDENAGAYIEVIAGGGGTGALVGATSLSIVPGPNTLTAKGTLTGATSLALSPGPSTLSGLGQLFATAAISFVLSGDLIGTGDLAGNSLLNITPVGTLRDASAGSISGTTSLALTPTGSLTATGSLNGLSVLSLLPTGSLTATGSLNGLSVLSLLPTGSLAGTGSLSSSVALAFTLSGFLVDQGAGTIAGTSVLSIVPSGILTGTGTLQSAVPLSITLSGTLLDQGGGALAGTSVLSILPSGILQGTGVLAGNSVLTLTPTGILTGASALSGTSVLTLTPTGILTGTGSLSGALPVSILPSGLLTSSGTLDGSLLLSLSPSGILIDGSTGNLNGAASLNLTPLGSLTGLGALDGLSVLSIILTGNLVPPASVIEVGKYSRQFDLANRLIKEKGSAVRVHRYSDPGPSAYDPLTDSPKPVVTPSTDRFSANAVLLPLTGAQVKDILMESPTALVSQKGNVLLSMENFSFPVEPGHRIVFDGSTTPSEEWWSIDTVSRLSPDLTGAPILYSMVVTRRIPESVYLPLTNVVYTNSISLAEKLIEAKGRDAIIRRYDYASGSYTPSTDTPFPSSGLEFTAPIVVLPLSSELDIEYKSSSSIRSERALALLAGKDITFIPVPGNRVLTGDAGANDWWSIEHVITLEPDRNKILYKLILTRGGGSYSMSGLLLTEGGVALLLEQTTGNILLEG